MWLFTTSGFFSAVKANGARNNVVVRARNIEHLRKLVIEHQLAAPILETEDRDYPCRIVIPRATWARVIAKEAERITYTNFKDAVREDVLHDALLRVWSTMRHYQDECK